MKYILPFLIAVACLPLSLHAQEIRQMDSIILPTVDEKVPSQIEIASRDSFDLPIIHVTDELMRSPEGQRALEEYRRMLESPPLFARQVAQPEVGDVLSFDVINFETRTFYALDFVLKVIQPRFNLWVSVTALDSNFVRRQDIDSLSAALGERTPERSFNPDAGIIENSEVIFGQPPDVDGNGKSTILIYNIQDGWEPGFGYIAGYFSTGVNSRNSADILNLDVLPGVYVPDDVDSPTASGRYQDVDNISATAAHEYQHLIMLDYDQNEITFVNEGLSEYAEIVNGYPIRTPTYLLAPVRYNIDLFDWRAGGNQLLDDYQRAGAFTNYLGDQIGVLETGLLTRLPETGIDGYNEILDQAGAGRNFETVLFDFHTANLVQNTDLNQRFGYDTRGRANNGATPKVVYDGRTSSSTEPDVDTLRAGGALYYRWEHVEEFHLTVDVAEDNQALRDRLHLRAILLDTTGSMSFRDFSPGAEPEVFAGAYTQVSIVAVDVEAEAVFTTEPDSIPFEYEATWTAPEIELETTVAAYDSGVINGDKSFFLVGNTDTSTTYLATKFDVPHDDAAVRLDRVLLPIYFHNQFSNGPPADAPRDFVLNVWTVGDNGEPDEVLYNQAYDDTRPHFYIQDLETDFLEIDLTAFSDDLSSLTDSIYVGYGSVGADDNFIVAVTSSYSVRNESQILLPSGWADLWDVSLTSETDTTSLEDTVIPIRAGFIFPSSVDAEYTPALPARITLEQNYPNPFAASTTIEYALARPAEVRLEIYDVLGRRVATLVDGYRAAGTYEASVDMSARASGMYIYRLQAGERILTRKMMRVR